MAVEVSVANQDSVEFHGSRGLHSPLDAICIYVCHECYRDHEGLGILAQNYYTKTSLIFTF